jgi:hypothetical protein
MRSRMRLHRRYGWTSPQNGRFVVCFGAGQQSRRVVQRMKREARRREWVLRRGSSCHQLIVVFVRGKLSLIFPIQCRQVILLEFDVG